LNIVFVVKSCLYYVVVQESYEQNAAATATGNTSSKKLPIDIVFSVVPREYIHFLEIKLNFLVL
jgi:hypothetical protein